MASGDPPLHTYTTAGDYTTWINDTGNSSVPIGTVTTTSATTSGYITMAVDYGTIPENPLEKKMDTLIEAMLNLMKQLDEMEKRIIGLERTS